MQIPAFQPDPKACARVRDGAMLPPVFCRYCHGASIVIMHHAEVYGGRVYSDWPWLYVCTYCDARVGMHPNTDIPLGILADEALRKLKNDSKKDFERIWRDQHMSRKQAYRWLAEQLGIPFAECHFGWFEADRCRQAAEVAKLYLQTLHPMARAFRQAHDRKESK